MKPRPLAFSSTNATIAGREQKIALIRRLDEKGVFQVQRAVPLLAQTFGTNRATIYNYLNEARGAAAEIPRVP